MSDFVMVDGDTLEVDFGPTFILVPAGPQALSGSSPDFFVRDSAVCRRGDELPPSLRGNLTYTDGAYTVPGQGTLAVSPTTTTVLANHGIAVLLKGTKFTATFTVTQPAKTPPSPASQPDPVSAKNGTGTYATSNDLLTAR
jgi:Contractile injection system spike tip protein